MTKLRGVDATFLYMETPETPMHVAGYTLFDLPEHYQGGRFHDHYRPFLISRLDRAAPLRRRLSPAPLHLDHPSWVEDAALDYDYHIRRLTISAPGDDAQVQEAVARLHAILLDRSRPLWQFYVIEGISRGRGAIYSKVHHAAIDGGAGMLLTKAMYDIKPRAVEPMLPAPAEAAGLVEAAVPAARTVPPPAAPEPARTALPDGAQFAGGMLDLYLNVMRTHLEVVQKLPEMLRAASNIMMPRLPAPGEPLLSALLPRTPLSKLPLSAPRTIFNVQITSERSFAARALSLTEAKRMGKAAGVKLNDIVLATCAGALRAYLAERDALPEQPLVAGVPVSLREVGNEDINNQVSMMLCSLATNLSDPVARLEAIRASSTAGKALLGDFKGALLQDYAFLGAPVVLHGMMALYGQSGLANWINFPANIAISNVPGPVLPLYCGEAKAQALYPVSIPTHGCAVNITVQSYLDELDFGVTADRRALPDPAHLLDLMARSFEELRARLLPTPASRPVEAVA